MENSQEKIRGILIQRGNELFKQPYKKIDFTKNPQADDLLNNLEEFSHAFTLACVMDRQVRAERAWLIPYEISTEINGFSISKLLKLDLNQFRDMFKRKKLHRFNDVMAENFYLAVQKIHKEYNDDASNIWKDNLKSATIVRRFLGFKGIGVKIATMAANILARDFKIPMRDYICIEVSPDRHVVRVFKRLGFIPKSAGNDELIYCARELNPLYPGIFDLSCWEIGRNWCKPRDPACKECYLNEYCPKKL